ncbi:hypothetical protein ACT7DL_11785 [Bacillus paranthracis]
MYFKWIRKRRESLQAYQWPGNVRELKHTIEHAVGHCRREYINVIVYRVHLGREFSKRRRAYYYLRSTSSNGKKINRSSVN